jgi:hypothetical protein
MSGRWPRLAVSGHSVLVPWSESKQTPNDKIPLAELNQSRRRRMTYQSSVPKGQVGYRAQRIPRFDGCLGDGYERKPVDSNKVSSSGICPEYIDHILRPVIYLRKLNLLRTLLLCLET